MVLRKLQEQDAPLMLEWMHDKSVNSEFYVNFESKTLADCVAFVNAAEKDSRNVHFAIVDEKNEYMGTVSLKNIDRHRKAAEFAIVTRSCARGTGLSKLAMCEIMQYAKEKCGLRYVYWNVKVSNTRAILFYNKNGYLRTDPSQIIWVDIEALEHKADLIWYLNCL